MFQSNSGPSGSEYDQNQTQEPRGAQGARGVKPLYRGHKLMVKVIRSHFRLPRGPRGPRVPRGLISVAVYSLIFAGALSISTKDTI